MSIGASFLPSGLGNNPNVTFSSNLATVDAIATDFPNLFDPQQIASGIYQEAVWEIFYQVDQHIAQLPVAGTSVSMPSLCYLANPCAEKIVKFVVEKTGDQPTLPSPFSTDPNEVLSYYSVVPRSLELEADAVNAIWHIEGEYRYWLRDTSKLKFYAGAVPYVRITFSNSEFKIQNFVTGLTSVGTETPNYQNIKSNPG